VSDYGEVVAQRHSGSEPLHRSGTPLDSRLSDFWSWSASDLLDNTLRGALAEFIVAKAIGDASAVRPAWAPYDLTTRDGIKVEVKSAAYVQSWSQSRPSRISFGIAPRFGWDSAAGTYDGVASHHADVYVFALLAHLDQDSIDPLNLDQWEFYVMPTRLLEQDRRHQKSLSLSTLRGLATPLKWEQIGEAVTEAHRQTA